MESSNQLISIIITIILCVCSLLCACYLIKRRNHFPHSNISPIWIAITLFSIILSQILSLLGDQFENIRLWWLIIYPLYIRGLIIVPLIIRAHSLGESIKFNSCHLTRRFYDLSFQSQSEKHFNSKLHYMSSGYLKEFFIPLTINYIISTGLILTPVIREALSAFIKCLYFIDEHDACNKPSTLFVSAAFNILLMIEIGAYLTMLYRIFSFNITEDKFYLKLEFVFLLFSWYCTNNLVIGVFYLTETKINQFMMESIKNSLIVVCYVIVTYIRSKITFEEIQKLLKDFKLFMNCTVTFNYFKDYIKNNNEEDYKLLSFWVEFNVYKELIESIREQKEQDESYFRNSLLTGRKSSLRQLEEELQEMSQGMFADYFGLNSSRLDGNSAYQIDFPIDIFEKISENIRRAYTFEQHETLFDDAFFWVEGKLHELFQIFCENSAECQKLEQIIFFIDYYEIKKQDASGYYMSKTSAVFE